MSNEYRIEKVSDFLQLDEDQFARIAPDFCEYYFRAREIIKAHPEADGQIQAFIWVDDGKNDFLGVNFIENDD